MNGNGLPALTPEQLRAIADGDGAAEFVDPETQQVYLVAPQQIECVHGDEYLREKLAEARADLAAGRVSTLSTDEVLAEARRRRQSGS